MENKYQQLCCIHNKEVELPLWKKNEFDLKGILYDHKQQSKAEQTTGIWWSYENLFWFRIYLRLLLFTSHFNKTQENQINIEIFIQV